TTTEAVSTTASTATPPAVVMAKTNARLGRILADANGMTLYTLTSNGRAVVCSATCASVWPPLELPPGMTTPTGAPEITGLGTASAPRQPPQRAARATDRCSARAEDGPLCSRARHPVAGGPRHHGMRHRRNAPALLRTGVIERG